MRPYGTSAQRAVVRQRAFDLLAQGLNVPEVAQRVGVNARSVRRWQHEARQPKRKTPKRRPGRPALLSPHQVQQLEKALDELKNIEAGN